MAGVATEESGEGGHLKGIQVDISSSDFNLGSISRMELWRRFLARQQQQSCESDREQSHEPKPSQLYGKYTWKIDKFSQINKRELRSNAFEVGGYKWYILIYPQGCDVCNHLSLFLCVANHDKLLPGWSHFAQFTIAVVNKDPKKSKYSVFTPTKPTLTYLFEMLRYITRFWKKEHDWGWKKFMELSKVMDGFIDADTLIIKAQVQVIRERSDRPFRCLDCQYRRELVRVYLTNVEQICRRFVEERRSKLGKLIEDKARWASLCGFWLGMDQSSRRRMSREKTGSILKVVVKHFFIEKEVTSTLVMDSLYIGLRALEDQKALEGQNKGKKSKGKHSEAEEFPVPIVRIENDTFVLVDDVMLLLERAAMEPLPPKDEKGPQNNTKDGTAGEEFNKDSIERDEATYRVGRRTIEIFVLAHIFSSKIEVAYQEAGKQKRNNRKGKDKGRDDKTISTVQDKIEEDSLTAEIKELDAEPEIVLEKLHREINPPDSEDRDLSPVNWDTDTSEVHPPIEASGSGLSGVQNGRGSSVVDDSSSTCSSDSVPSVVISRKNHQSKLISDSADWVNEDPCQPVPDARHSNDASSQSPKTVRSLPRAVVQSFPDRVVNGTVQQVDKKDEETGSLQRNFSGKGAVDADISKERAACVTSPPRSPSKIIPLIARLKLGERLMLQVIHSFLTNRLQTVLNKPIAPCLFVSKCNCGGPVTGSTSAYSQNHSATSVVNASHSYSQAPSLASAPLFSPHSSDRTDPNPIKPSLSFGMQTTGSPPSEFPAGTSDRQSHLLQDEFPHLDIISELLDDEHGIGMVARVNSGYQSFSNEPHNLNRQYSFLATLACQVGQARHVGTWIMIGIQYHIPEYPNVTVGINGYTVFRPSNGL
ncbi:hypothetical protein DH2020_043549 [Rehmannia glutinosa]|uniref:MATH domain-containing protein n=1 Tax=Rehmannia glutinosa TaxID=99300 RepID=A0ABR0UJB6_REHGL